MKILLYFENESMIHVSGIGRAFDHQKKALTFANIEYTTDLNCTDYDILHINTVLPLSDFVIRQARRLNKKVIYHAHSTEEDFRDSFVFSNVFSPIFKQMLINLYSKSDAIITPTPYSKRLIENYGITVPIYPISNGIDLSNYAESDAKKQQFYESFPYLRDKKWVMGVGLPFKRKGILDFIEVAKALPQYEFVWFGELNSLLLPTDINEALSNYPSNCHFPGYVQGDVIQGAYQATNCFFFPTYEETEGIVVLEALASHQNVLVRNIGAFEPWLVDKESCYKGKSIQEFITLIPQIIEGELPSLVDQGYEVAKARSIDRIGFELKKVYESVL
ncbi:MAG: glycosyltransferase [Solobacterium sp.]|nr:glycosyltransferase [Solobacterium sp.]